MAVQISGNDITVPRDGTFSRNVSIAGTLTYEDVTNVDSIGIVTARNGIEVGARPGVAASISVDGNMIVSGISTFDGNIIGGGEIQSLTKFESKSGNDLRLNAGSVNRDIFLQVNDSTLMTVQGSTGNAGIGTVTPSGLLHTHAASGTNRNYIEASAGNSFLRLKAGSTSHNSGVEFFSGSSNIANVSGLGAGGLQFEVGGAERLTVASGGDVTVKTGNLVIGTAGKGIDFSAQTATSASGSSATSELLDHYEEGTWTPAIIGSSSNPSHSTSSAQGRYVRIGSNVTLYMLIIVNSVSGQGSGNYGISGLPFGVTSDLSSYAMVGVVGYNDVFNSTVNKCYANSNNSITFIPDGVTQGNVTISGNSFSTGYLGLTLSYHTS